METRLRNAHSPAAEEEAAKRGELKRAENGKNEKVSEHFFFRPSFDHRKEQRPPPPPPPQRPPSKHHTPPGPGIKLLSAAREERERGPPVRRVLPATRIVQAFFSFPLFVRLFYFRSATVSGTRLSPLLSDSVNSRRPLPRLPSPVSVPLFFVFSSVRSTPQDTSSCLFLSLVLVASSLVSPTLLPSCLLALPLPFPPPKSGSLVPLLQDDHLLS